MSRVVWVPSMFMCNNRNVIGGNGLNRGKRCSANQTNVTSHYSYYREASMSLHRLPRHLLASPLPIHATSDATSRHTALYHATHTVAGITFTLSHTFESRTTSQNSIDTLSCQTIQDITLLKHPKRPDCHQT